ncbi:ASCH domain-containing protein [Marisediminicola sp. LYQ134]|uniref:ASCH domain-containing protein n=1 Tax=Marisediminicola sp. LYQ134 TaxID=3391061 RepID=UPI0039838367
MSDDLPIIEFAFPGPLRDRLLAAIESGAKTTTSSLLVEYEVGDEPVPVPGHRGVAVDSAGEKTLVIETTAVDIVPLRSVSLHHALAEGEGYETVADWRAGHMTFWSSDEMRLELGPSHEVTDDSLVVIERFVVVR